MTFPLTEKNWWDNEAHGDVRYRTLAWGGDGTPEQVQPTIDAELKNLSTALRLAAYSPRTVVEIGCGPGRLLHRMARAHPKDFFVGVDTSYEMAMLRVDDRPENASVVISDGRSLPIDAADMVYSVEVFQHLDATAKAAYLEQTAAILAPKGLAVIQYVEGVDEDLFMAHPETTENMHAMVAACGLKHKTVRGIKNVHDEWRWMVLTK